MAILFLLPLIVGLMGAVEAAQMNELGIYSLEQGSWNEVIDSQKFTIVKFYAPWCGFCQELEPIFEELALEFDSESSTQIQFAEVNCDQPAGHSICQQEGITGYPAIHMYHDGTMVDIFTEDRTYEDLSSFIKEYIDVEENDPFMDVSAALMGKISEMESKNMEELNKDENDEEKDNDNEDDDGDDEDDEEEEEEIENEMKVIQIEVLKAIIAKESNPKVTETLERYITKIKDGKVSYDENFQISINDDKEDKKAEKIKEEEEENKDEKVEGDDAKDEAAKEETAKKTAENKKEKTSEKAQKEKSKDGEGTQKKESEKTVNPDKEKQNKEVKKPNEESKEPVKTDDKQQKTTHTEL